VLEGIPWSVIGGLTPSALLSIVVLLILTGKIVPKSTYDAMVQSKEHWRDTAEKRQETNHTLARAVDKQQIASDTIIKTMHALQEANHRDGGTP